MGLNISMEGKFKKMRYMKDSFKMGGEKVWDAGICLAYKRKEFLMNILLKVKSLIKMAAHMRENF